MLKALLRRFKVKKSGVNRMNAAIDRLKNTIRELDASASEIADQRALLDAEKTYLLDRIDEVEELMDAASGDICRAHFIASDLGKLVN